MHAIKTPRQPRIGVLSPFLGDEFFGNTLLGIDRAAQQQGSRALAIQTRPQSWLGHETTGVQSGPFVPYALDHVDALISITDAVTADDLKQLQHSGKPIVTICAYFPELGIPAVFPDNHIGVSALVRHLVEHGHTRIGFAGYMNNADVRERWESYAAALQEAGIEPDPHLCFETSDLIESGGNTAADAMLAAGVPCTALCVATDQNALTIIRRIQEAGYTVPGDLAVVAFDDVQVSATSIPSLTTVHQFNGEIGATAARLVLAQLAGREVLPRKTLVPVQPIFRQSCGCWTHARTTPPVPDAGAGSRRRMEVLQWAVVAEALPIQGIEMARRHADLLAAAGRIVAALAVVVSGGPLPAPGMLTRAWRDICTAGTSIEAVGRAFGALERGAEGFLDTEPHDASAPLRVREFLDEMRTELLYAARYQFVRRALDFETINGRNHQTNLRLLALREESARDLAWLGETLASAGCLGIWRDDVTGSELTIAGVFRQGETRSDRIGEPCCPTAFPPLDVLESAMRDNPDQMVMVLPLRATDHDWGALALLSPPELQLLASDVGVWQWTAPLMAALARERLTRERERLKQLLEESERRRARMELERERTEKDAYRAAAARLEELNRQLAETNNLKTELLEQSQAQATAAQGLATLRSDFVATVSHELRTPLTAIVGYAELLQAHWAELADEDRLDRVDRIVVSANRQQRLVEDLLLVSRLEIGALAPKTQTVLLQSLIDRAASEVRSSYIGQQIEIEGPGDLQVLADPDRTVQVLVNILDNAAKYSPEGSPVHIRFARETPAAAVLVRDHGAGISVEGLDRLFTRFGRASGSPTRSGRVGTGLGLFISRSLAQAMGGDLQLESTGCAGSVFRLTLRLSDGSVTE